MKNTYVLIIFCIFGLNALSQDIKFLKIKSLSGSIRMEYQKISENENNNSSNIYDYNEKYYQGGLEVKMSGYSYHPNFLDFNIYADIVANKTSYTYFSDESILNSNDNTYDMSFHFLKKKKFSFQPYFKQSYTNAGQRFGGRHYNKMKNNGIRMFGNTKRLPFILDMYKSETSYSSLTIQERVEKSDNIEFKMDIFSTNKTSSRLQANYKDYVEKVYDVNYSNTRIVWDFSHGFGDKNKNRFFTNFNYYQMAGDNDNTNFNILSSITFQLPKHFSTFLYLTINENSTTNYKLSFQELSAGINHRLFESLDSSMLIAAKNESDDAHRLKTTSGELAINYRKKIPTGLLRMGFIQRVEELNNTSKGGISSKTEILSFEFTDVSIISFPGVQLSSIVLMDTLHTRTYLEGVDYSISELNGVIYITRIPGGDIPEGSNIEVRYFYIALPDYLMTNHRYSDLFAIRFFKYFEVAYFSNTNNSSITSEYSLSPFETFKSRKTSYRFVSSLINGEYNTEKYKSSLADYNLENWQASAGKSLFKKLRFSYSISKNSYTYTENPRFTEFFNTFATISYFTQRGSTLNITYRETDYSSESSKRYRETLLTRFRWQFRQLSLETTFEHILEDTDFQNRKRNYFNISLRRTF